MRVSVRVSIQASKSSIKASARLLLLFRCLPRRSSCRSSLTTRIGAKEPPTHRPHRGWGQGYCSHFARAAQALCQPVFTINSSIRLPHTTQHLSCHPPCTIPLIMDAFEAKPKPKENQGGLQISLDLTSAFDVLSWELLMQSMEAAQLPDELRDWVGTARCTTM